jgi:positive regulator of sigma E activity
VLYRPLSFAWLTLVSLVFAAAIIAFLVLASYTRKEEKMVSDPNLLSAKWCCTGHYPLHG